MRVTPFSLADTAQPRYCLYLLCSYESFIQDYVHLFSSGSRLILDNAEILVRADKFTLSTQSVFHYEMDGRELILEVTRLTSDRAMASLYHSFDESESVSEFRSITLCEEWPPEFPSFFNHAPTGRFNIQALTMNTSDRLDDFMVSDWPQPDSLTVMEVRSWPASRRAKPSHMVIIFRCRSAAIKEAMRINTRAPFAEPTWRMFDTYAGLSRHLPKCGTDITGSPFAIQDTP